MSFRLVSHIRSLTGGLLSNTKGGKEDKKKRGKKKIQHEHVTTGAPRKSIASSGALRGPNKGRDCLGNGQVSSR